MRNDRLGTGLSCGLVQSIIEFGFELFRDTDRQDHNSVLLSMFAAQTGVDLAI